MVGHAHPADRNSEIVIDDRGARLARIETKTPRKTTRQIIERAKARGWMVTWESGFREARDTIGYNSYTLKRGDEFRQVTVYFPIPADMYLGAM